MLIGEASRPPSRVVTFLFTDIEGSTRRWEADAEATRAALETHNEVLREAVKSHDGHVFNYTGDGMCAVFTSPRSAVDAAVSAQLELELPVRMGIATGEAQLRGGDYFGTVLNRTARVMAAGHGGQILLDGATAGLLAGVDLMSLGPRRLRDIAKPVDVFQVRARGLRAEFPPLKTVDPTLGNLRTPTTSLVGRETELAELQTALKAHRVVTLTGVGGVGKTRLALEVAARSASDFPDGVFVIELAAVGDPGAVPDAVAAVLGITQQPGMSLADSIASALEGRSRLLVFDNCEHLLDAHGPATFLGIWTERYEPIAWAEELVEPAKAIGHRRLAQLYATAAQCYATGRIEKSIGYIAAGQQAIVGGYFDEVPYEFDVFFSTGYLTAGEPERTVDWCRRVISRNPGPHNLAHAALVVSLMVTGAYDEAVAASGGLLAAADATDNPVEKCLLRLAYGWAYRDVDPAAADDALRRGLSIARDSGNQQQEASIAVSLARRAVRYGQPTDAFDYIILATRHYYDSGSLSLMPGPLGLLAVLFDRLGQFEAAASIIEFAATPINRASHPEIDTTIIHLREVLGNDAYESFARAGTNMTNAAMAEYAFEEIDRVCAEVLQ